MRSSQFQGCGRYCAHLRILHALIAVGSLNHLVRFGKDDGTVSCAGLKSSQFQGCFRYFVLNLDAVCSLKDDALMCFVGDADTASRAGLEAIWRQRS